MKQLFTCLLVLSIFFSLAYFSYTAAQEGPHSGPVQNKPVEQQSPFCPSPVNPHGPKVPPQDLTEAQLQELMTFCKEYFPTFYSHIAEIKDSNPGIYKKITGEKFALMLHLKEVMKKDGEFFKVIVRKLELEDKSADLSRKYREAEGDTKTSIEHELYGVLTELFSLRQKESQLHADKMEKELKHIRDVIAEREKNKEAIIKDGINKLTGKSEYLEW